VRPSALALTRNSFCDLGSAGRSSGSSFAYRAHEVGSMAIGRICGSWHRITLRFSSSSSPTSSPSSSSAFIAIARSTSASPKGRGGRAVRWLHRGISGGQYFSKRAFLAHQARAWNHNTTLTTPALGIPLVLAVHGGERRRCDSEMGGRSATAHVAEQAGACGSPSSAPCARRFRSGVIPPEMAAVIACVGRG
jgi:hypothetical protein